MIDLVELIQSLNQSEKRFFTRFSHLQQEHTPRYLVLFHDLQKVNHDEKKLKIKYGHKLFAQYKQQLQNRIIESLLVYYSGNDYENKILNEIFIAQILNFKGLKTTAIKKICKTTEKIGNEDFLFAELYLQRKQNLILAEGSNVTDLQKQLKKFKNSSSQIIRKIECELLYEAILLEVSIYKEEIESVRSQTEANKIQTLLNDKLLRNERYALTVYSKMIYYYSNGLLYFLLGDFKKSSLYNNQLLIILNKTNLKYEHHRLLYEKAIFNCILVKIYISEFTIAQQLIDTFKSQKAFDQDHKNYLLFLLELIFLNKQRKFNEALKLIKTNFKNTTKFELSPAYDKLHQQQLYAIFNKVQSYFGIGEYKAAAKEINNFLSKFTTIKRDMYYVLRIINLIIHFELGNEQLLTSEIQSVLRIFKKQKNHYIFEQLFLDFIKKIQYTSSIHERNKFYKELSSKLNLLQSIKYENSVLNYFDFLYWLDKKTKN